MSDVTHRCMRCGGELEEGYVLDDAVDRRLPSIWVEGPPDTGPLGTRTRGKRRFRVASFRCRGCGWLESFAGRPEQIECLECNATLPPDASVCPACGWTWTPDRR